MKYVNKVYDYKIIRIGIMINKRNWSLTMCVIQAIEGDSLFTLSERFTINITPEAYTVFTPTPAGNARYQKPGDAQWAAMMLEKIRTMNKMK